MSSALAVPRTSWVGLRLVLDSDNAYIAVARRPHAHRRSTFNMENIVTVPTL